MQQRNRQKRSAGRTPVDKGGWGTVRHARVSKKQGLVGRVRRLNFILDVVGSLLKTKGMM